MGMFVLGALCASAVYVAMPNVAVWLNAKIKGLFGG